MAEPTDKDTRGPVNLRIKFRSESLQQFIERYGVDVSRGGIFIRTREPLPVGTRLKLDFQLVDTAPLFQGDGTVVWIREHDASRAGVTPGMGVRFDRLTPESQTTLDTILEEKIRLQQSGVAPGSIAKAGAGIAVRRPSGAFATLDSQTARPSGPPPLPVGVKLDTPIAPPISGPGAQAHVGSPGAAPVAVMPMSGSRSGQHATGSSSIFTRPRTTSGMRAVPVPSALFEQPTAADIDQALSVLEEKGGPAPALPFTPVVVKAGASASLGEDEPTKVFDSTSAEEFSANEAITGPAQVVPDTGIPIETEGDEGDMTQRALVDPTDGKLRGDFDLGALDGRSDGKAPPPPPIPLGGAAKPVADLDAPLASLVDSGSAPAAKPPVPPPMKPSAPSVAVVQSPAKPPAAAKPAAAAVGRVTAGGVPVRVTTDRPAATESGRFRSDARYKRGRGKGLQRALMAVVIVGGLGAGGFYMWRQHAQKAAADALAAAAAAEAAAKAAALAPPTPPPAPPQGAETAPGTTGAPANPPEAAGPSEAAKTEKPTPAVEAKGGEKTADKTGEKTDKVEKGGKAEKQAATEKSARTEEGSSSSRHRREKTASAGESAKAATPKPDEAAGEKKAAGDEAAKAGDTAKTADTGKSGDKSGDTAKSGDKSGEGDKTGETAKSGEKSAEAAPSAVTERPVLKITSSPAGADIVIDGVPVGTTPFSSRDVTSDGTHAISVKKDGYETHERMISGSDWSRGKGGALSLKVSVKLKRAAGEKPPAPADTGEKKPPDVEILTPSDP